MLELIHKGGPFMSLMVLIVIVIVGLVIKKIVDLFFRKGLDTKQQEYGLNAILFWGIISAVLGVTAQLLGIYIAINAIIEAADVSPQLILMGYQVSFISTLFGLYIFIFSALAWFLLRWRYKRMIP